MARRAKDDRSRHVRVSAPDFDPPLLLPGGPENAPGYRDDQETLSSRNTEFGPLAHKFDVHPARTFVATLEATIGVGQFPSSMRRCTLRSRVASDSKRGRSRN